MNKVRVAVVGAGFISSARHVPAYKRLANRVQVVAISDVNRDSAEKVAKQAGIPQTYSDAAEMIEHEKPDLVDICTPPATHATLAMAAMRHGCNLLIEKPMATTLEDCDRIVDTSRKLGVNVCVAHTGLFYDPFIEARAVVESGRLGEFRGMRIAFLTPTNYMTSNREHWCHKLPGGAIGETAPHPVYMSLALLKQVERVTVDAKKVLADYPWSRYEDYRINLVGAGGMSTISVNYATNQWLIAVEIVCSRGVIAADLHGRVVTVMRRPELKVPAIGLSLLSHTMQVAQHAMRSTAKQLIGYKPSTHDRLIRSYVDRLIRCRPSPVPAEEGREAVKVMRMIVESLDSQDSVHRQKGKVTERAAG